MEKIIKAIVLTNNQVLVSQIDEVGADIGQPDCKLTNPYMLKDDGTMEPWLINISRQDVFMISSDKILTITEPMPTLVEKYEELTK
jgi:hypothetical protein|tara:strand:- start:290 stop:547 length:258 start_codon:yes stop_codon:yes gene_type:complete